VGAPAVEAEAPGVFSPALTGLTAVGAAPLAVVAPPLAAVATAVWPQAAAVAV
jgi:hypothetical protein